MLLQCAEPASDRQCIGIRERGRDSADRTVLVDRLAVRTNPVMTLSVTLLVASLRAMVVQLLSLFVSVSGLHMDTCREEKKRESFSKKSLHTNKFSI